MNFNTKGKNAKNEKAPMQPGEKVKATFNEAEVNEKGDLVFKFSSTSGRLTHTEFNIDPSHEKFNEVIAESQIERIKHIACAFLDEEEVDSCEGETYEKWAKQLVEKLRSSFGTPCTLKVVLNKKDYSSLPLFANFISTEKTPLDWSSNPKYDRYEPLNLKPDAEKDVRTEELADDDEDDDESF